jgi:hypothetical protein
MQFLKSRAQERNLRCQTASKNMLWGCTFQAFKVSRNWGYLIKRPSGRQDVKVWARQISFNTENCFFWVCVSHKLLASAAVVALVVAAAGGGGLHSWKTSHKLNTKFPFWIVHSLQMAKMQSTSHRLVLIWILVHNIFSKVYIVCAVSCLNITVQLSALHAVSYIEQVCIYKFK